MTENDYLVKLKSGEQMRFEDLMQVIDDNYQVIATQFTNGDLQNSATENQGSAKLLSFAKIHQLTDEQTLRCFGQYYDEVLNDKTGKSHANIRNIIKTGLANVQFEQLALNKI
jgi:hypothetical protein